MGISARDVPTTREAEARGLGTAEIGSIRLRGDPLEEFKGRPFCLPSASRIRKVPRPLINIARKLIRYRPRIDEAACVKCGTCVSVCPNKAISMGVEGVLIDYSKCIACFCCQESCPYSAISISKSLLARIARL
jgi:ferredoxin